MRAILGLDHPDFCTTPHLPRARPDCMLTAFDPLASIAGLPSVAVHRPGLMASFLALGKIPFCELKNSPATGSTPHQSAFLFLKNLGVTLGLSTPIQHH